MALGVLGSVVVEEVIFTTGDAGDFLHVVLYDFGDTVVVFVASLAVLEEYVTVLGHTACYGVGGVEGTCAEVGESLLVHQGSEVVLVHGLDLLDFVRCAETVKEVEEGHTALEGGEVGYTCEVHNLLYGAFGQHGEACLAACHHVLVVTED